MKHSLVLLAFTALALFLNVSASAETPLVDKGVNNGGFESETLSPWFGQSDTPGCSIESGAGLAKEGSQCCRVRLERKESTRATARLFQNFNKVDPADGRHFIVKCDVEAVSGHPSPKMMGEFVFFEGDAVLKTVGLQAPTGPFADWSQIELPMSAEIPSEWTGGKVQFRLIFFVDGGSPSGEVYELLIDNVSVVQRENP